MPLFRGLIQLKSAPPSINLTSLICRFVVTRLDGTDNLFLCEIKISAFPIKEIFINSSWMVNNEQNKCQERSSHWMERREGGQLSD